MDLQPVGDTLGLWWGERFVERGFGVRVQIVHDQNDLLGIREVQVHQVAHHIGPIHGRASLCHFHVPPGQKRSEQHEEGGSASPDILIVLPQCTARLHSKRCPAVGLQLLETLVQADERPFGIEGTLVNVEYILHRTHEGGVLLGRYAPAFF
jgi:hypothetical protein